MPSPPAHPRAGQPQGGDGVVWGAGVCASLSSWAAPLSPEGFHRWLWLGQGGQGGRKMATLAHHLLPEANGPKPTGLKMTSCPRGGPEVAQDLAPFPPPPPQLSAGGGDGTDPRTPSPVPGLLQGHTPRGPHGLWVQLQASPSRPGLPGNRAGGGGQRQHPHNQQCTYCWPGAKAPSSLLSRPPTGRAGSGCWTGRGLLVIKAGWQPPGPCLPLHPCPTSSEEAPRHKAAQSPALPGPGLSLAPGDTPGPHASTATPCSAP